MVQYPCIKTCSPNTKYHFALRSAWSYSWKKIKVTVALPLCTYLCCCLDVCILLRNIKHPNLLPWLLANSGFSCCILLVSWCSWNRTLIVLLFSDCWMRILLLVSPVTLYCAFWATMSHRSQCKRWIQCRIGSVSHLPPCAFIVRDKSQRLCWNPPLSFVAWHALCRDLS